MGCRAPRPRLYNNSEYQDEVAAVARSRSALMRILVSPFKLVTLLCDDFDKRGRLQGSFFVDGINVNDYMLKKGYVTPRAKTTHVESTKESLLAEVYTCLRSTRARSIAPALPAPWLKRARAFR